MKIKLGSFFQPKQALLTFLLILPFLFAWIFNLLYSSRIWIYWKNLPFRCIGVGICVIITIIGILITKEKNSVWIWFSMGAIIFYLLLFSPLLVNLHQGMGDSLEYIVHGDSLLNQFTHIYTMCDSPSCSYSPLLFSHAIIGLLIFAIAVLFLMWLGIRIRVILGFTFGWLAVYWVALDWLYYEAHIYSALVEKLYQQYALLIPILIMVAVIVIRLHLCKRLSSIVQVLWYSILLFIATNLSFLRAIQSKLFDFSESIYEGNHHFASNMLALIRPQFDLHWVRPLMFIGILLWLAAVPILILRAIRTKSFSQAFTIHRFQELTASRRLHWCRARRQLILYFVLPIIILAGAYRTSIKVTELDWRLKAAVEKGDRQKVLNLLARGANINIKEYLSENSLLRVPVCSLDHEMIILLLDHEISPLLCSNANPPTLYLLIDRYEYWHSDQSKILEILQILLERGAEINCQSYYGETPLHKAISNRNTILVRFLLKYKPNIHIPFRESPDYSWTVAEYPQLKSEFRDDEIVRLIEEYILIEKYISSQKKSIFSEKSIRSDCLH